MYPTIASLFLLLASCDFSVAQPAGMQEHPYPDSVLIAVQNMALDAGTASYMILHDGAEVDAYGDVTEPVLVQSVRKSVLSMLIGMAHDRGEIDLEMTLGELGMDDLEPLSEAEKQATVQDLLTARSGVYHPAAASTPHMLATLPPRGTHAPGTFFLYNNWDFNVLGSIYRQQTGRDIFQALYDDLAVPLGLHDFLPEHGLYFYEDMSEHPAYHMRLSTRDMATLGQLMLQDGQWDGGQLISEAWMAESTDTWSDGQYGYMWWTNIPGIPADVRSYAARGGDGHFLLVVPEWKLVFVHRVPMDRAHTIDWGHVIRMIRTLNAWR